MNKLKGDRLPFNKAFNAMVEQVIRLTKDAPEAFVLPTHGDMKEGLRPEREVDMKKTIFAIPLAGGKLCSHFGHCEQFALIETENGKITGKRMQPPPPHEPGLLPRWLKGMGAHVIIAGGMGSRAQQLFLEGGIKVITGAPMDPPESLVDQYMSNTLTTGENVCDH